MPTTSDVSIKVSDFIRQKDQILKSRPVRMGGTDLKNLLVKIAQEKKTVSETIVT